jgi:deoxyadenosine/deoxycytidine kinase
MKKFIAVAGNIGVGKSTLVRLLSAEIGFFPFYEPVTENPYLADFYKDMTAWSFHSQIFFLGRRLMLHQELANYPDSVIQDRSIYEDAEVFARNLSLQGLLNERDFQTYDTLYQSIIHLLPAPDLLIYLRASVDTLSKRILSRGRNYEIKIDPAYLIQLNNLYESWISHFALCPVLTIPADNLNFVQNQPHLQMVVKKVKEKLTGKDEVVFSPEDFYNNE